jgi:pyruvate oxidase
VLSERCPEDAILCVDVGNNTYSFGRYFESRGQPVLMSGYLGSIGFALPAALGAAVATREEGPFRGRKVVSISGDAGLAQYLAELTTLVRHDLDVTHVVLNNRELGKISKEQRGAELAVWQTAMVDGHFAAVAEAFGVRAWHVDRPEALEPALAEAMAHRGPALVEIIQDPLGI